MVPMHADAMRADLARHAREGDSATVVPGLTLHRASAPTEAVATLHQPAICVILQGAKRTLLGNVVHDYDHTRYMILPVELPLTSIVTRATPEEPFLALSVELDMAVLAALVLEVHDSRPEPAATSAMWFAPTDRHVLDALHRLIALLDQPEDVPILAPLVGRELLYLLLKGPHGPVLRQIATATGRFAGVERAAAWIRENFTARLRVDTLAREAGMGVSSFHQHFKTVTGLTPLGFQKQVRFQEARKLLLVGGDVARVGQAVGFDNPSQFSREYRRTFGQPPGKDARGLRRRSADLPGHDPSTASVGGLRAR